jgi:hypothetical protein
MRRWQQFALLGSLASLLCAQQFKFNLDHLSSKASNVVDISLGGPLLQLGARFLDGKDPDQAAVKKMVSGLEGIYVKSFEFKLPGGWTMADLDAVRSQLKSPEWTKMVGYSSAADGENAEIYIRMDEWRRRAGVRREGTDGGEHRRSRGLRSSGFARRPLRRP